MLVEVHQGDIRPFLRKQDGDGASDAAVAACN
jgi:hypothetical protein